MIILFCRSLLFRFAPGLMIACCLLFAPREGKCLATLEGMVRDSARQAVDAATVSLFRQVDSAFIKAELTDVQGHFTFSGVAAGTYYIHVHSLGYQPYQSEVFHIGEAMSSLVLPDVRLMASGMTLEEISVVAQKPFIERKADRLIVHVDNSIVAAGSSAMEVLERAPGVIVSSGDAISIRGRSGVIFMIDGKITPMSGQELANYLRGLPSGSIDRIEIITNPSAKYDAAGNAGIIDIRLKKNTADGTNGSVTTNVAQGIYPKAGAGINFNHRQDQFNLYGGYTFNFRKGFNDLRLYRAFFESGVRTGAYDQKNYLVFPFRFHMGRLGIDYNVSPQTVIGLLASTTINGFSKSGQNRSRVENGMQETISSFITDNQGKDRYPSFSLNGNMKHTWPKGKQELTMDLDYAKYESTSDQLFTTRYYDLQGQEYLPSYLLDGDLRGSLTIQSIKADFTWPVSEKVRLEAGLKSSLVSADNDLRFLDASDAQNPVLDSTISNHFLYDETIHAAYINVNYAQSKWSLQSGLRVENTLADGNQLFNGNSFDRRYTNFFPSIFLNYTISKAYSMGLNMSRRLDRPSYQQLNPFKFFLDPSTYREGNPYLNPQFTWSFEWNHTLLQRFTATISYARTYANITQVIAPVEGVDRVTVQTDINLGEVDYYSINAGIPISIGKNWNCTNNLSYYLGQYRGAYAETPLNDGNWVLDLRSNNSFTLGHDWSAEVNVFYHSRELYAYMDLDPMWGLSTGVQKMLFNRRGTLKLSLSDIFWTSLPAADIVFRDYTETFDVFRDTRQIALSYTHRFGDNQLAPSRRRVGGAEEEKQRAGNTGNI